MAEHLTVDQVVVGSTPIAHPNIQALSYERALYIRGKENFLYPIDLFRCNPGDPLIKFVRAFLHCERLRVTRSFHRDVPMRWGYNPDIPSKASQIFLGTAHIADDP